MDNIYILLINVFTALATGGAVVVVNIWEKGYKKARESANQLVWLMFFVSLGIMALVYIGKEFILTVVFGHITKKFIIMQIHI